MRRKRSHTVRKKDDAKKSHGAKESLTKDNAQNGQASNWEQPTRRHVFSPLKTQLLPLLIQNPRQGVSKAGLKP